MQESIFIQEIFHIHARIILLTVLSFHVFSSIFALQDFVLNFSYLLSHCIYQITESTHGDVNLLSSNLKF